MVGVIATRCKSVSSPVVQQRHKTLLLQILCARNVNSNKELKERRVGMTVNCFLKFFAKFKQKEVCALKISTSIC